MCGARRAWFLGLVTVGLLLPLRADLDAARAARALLGPETWSRVLQIENRLPGRYPPSFYATVFEFDGILWFYTPSEGTQSLSQYRHRVRRDRAELGPLLRALHPGFARFEVVPTTDAQPAPAIGTLPQGCFIDSVVELRRRLAAGAEVAGARLLAIYLAVPGQGRVGHTGLLLSTPVGTRFWDPNEPTVLRAVAAPEAGAVAIAQALVPRGVTVESARFWTVSAREMARGLYASRTAARGAARS